jgi:hypothetical protein
MKAPNDGQQLPAAMLAKLNEVRRLSRRVSLVTGLFRGATLLLAAMLVAMALDWWVVLYDERWRWALTLCALACAAVGFALTGLLPLFRKRSLASLARQVDQAHPALEERFLTLAEFAQSQDAAVFRGSEAMLRKVAEQAATLSSAIAPEGIVPRTSLVRARQYLALALGVLALLLLLAFSQAKILCERFWAPGSNITLTQVHALTGDRVIGKGENLTLGFTTTGKASDSASLLLRSAKGKNEVLPLRRGVTPGAKFVYARNSVADSFEYRARSGDGQTPWHKVTVAERPRLKEVKLRLAPPAYSHLPVVEEQSLPRKVRALEGSLLEVSFQSDLPLAGMGLRFADGKTLPLNEGPGHRYQFNALLTNSFSFTPVLTSTQRLENSSKPSCEIVVYPDEPPTVKVVSPSDEITARPDDVVKIEFEARDDFGIAEAKLLVTVKTETNTTSIAVPIPLGDERGAKLLRKQVDLDLKQFHLQQDQELTYSVQVTDTKENLALGMPGGAEPTTNLVAQSATANDSRVQQAPGASTNSSNRSLASAGSTNSPSASNGSGSGQNKQSSLALNSKPPGAAPPRPDSDGSRPPPNNMPMRTLDVAGQCSACQPRKILVDEWGRSFEGQMREKLEIAIDPTLQLLDELLGKAQKLTDSTLETARSTPGLTQKQQPPLEMAKGHLRQADTAVTELKAKCQDTPYAFIGLQLHDIRETYISPARGHLAHMAFEPARAKEDVTHLEQASFDIQQAREKLRDLTRSYAAVKRDYKLADAMQRLQKMHQIFLENTQAMLGSSKPLLNNFQRRVAEVDDEFVEKLRKLLEEKKKIMAELAKILADDPRLLRRFMAMQQLEGTTLRDQMTLLAQRQQTLATQVAQWLGTEEKDRDALLRGFLAGQSAEQGDLAALAAKLSENMITWLPLDVAPDAAPIVDCRKLAAEAARLAAEASSQTSPDAINTGLDSALKSLEQLRLLHTRLPDLEQLPESGQRLSVFVANRMSETANLVTRQSGWLSKIEALRRGDYALAAEVDQHRLAVDTAELSDKLDSSAAMVGRLSAEISAKAGELTGTVHDQVLPEQTGATDALSTKTDPRAADHQAAATKAFAVAEKQFDELLNLIIAKLDAEPPPTDVGDAPTLEQLLAMLEDEAKACEKLGIPCRPINVAILKDWLRPGSCSGSAQALAQARGAQNQARTAVEKTRRASEQAKKVAQKRASELAGSQQALPTSGPKRPSRSWNTVVSQLGDELRQGRDNIPPEQYRQAIEQYFKTISERIPIPAASTNQLDH